MKRKLSSGQPDLILTFTFKPNIFGKWAAGRTPVIGTVTGLGTPFMRGGMIRRMAKALYCNAYGGSGILFFHNDRDRQFFIDNDIIAPDRTDVVPGSGIDTHNIVPLQSIDTGRTVFLYLGRIMPEKGIMELLEAANVLVERYRNVSVILAGRWVHSGTLNTHDFKTMTAHPRVRYLGHLDDLESVWKMADCLVLPSYREGLSRSILEAMARAVPVIASDVPGCEDLLREGGGWLVRAGDADGLLNAMEHVTSLSQEEKRSIGLQGRKTVEGAFSTRSMSAKYQKKAEDLTFI